MRNRRRAMWRFLPRGHMRLDAMLMRATQAVGTDPSLRRHGPRSSVFGSSFSTCNARSSVDDRNGSTATSLRSGLRTSTATSRVHRRRSRSTTVDLEPAPRQSALPDHLTREDMTLDVEGGVCPCCGGALHAIGESISEMLDFRPARLHFLRLRRPKYGCRACVRPLSLVSASEGTICQRSDTFTKLRPISMTRSFVSGIAPEGQRVCYPRLAW
jgi:hypothetical protein